MASVQSFHVFRIMGLPVMITHCVYNDIFLLIPVWTLCDFGNFEKNMKYMYFRN